MPHGRGVYTALGNCLPAGAGGLLVTAGYPVHLRRMLEPALGMRLELRNHGRLFGLYTRELVELLQSDPRVRRDVRAADVITYNAGENELLWVAREHEAGRPGSADQALDHFAQVYPRAVDALLDLARPGQALIRTFSIYCCFPDHPQARYVDRFNDVVLTATSARGNRHGREIPVANVNGLFRRGPLRPLLGFDGVHPSRRGHVAIARAMFDLGTRPV